MSNHTLTKLASEAPIFTGIYIMMGGNKKILYVGKAKNIKKRLLGHIRYAASSTRHAIMLRQVESMEYIQTTNDEGALLLESKLINKYKPLYNVAIKTEGRLFLAIDLSEEFPSVSEIYLSRSPQENLQIFGPFANKKTSKFLASTIHEVFKLRSCSTYKFMQRKTCLEFDLGRCSGPCEDKISKESYRNMTISAIKLLSGQSDAKHIVAELERYMLAASRVQNYKLAIQYRNAMQTVISLADRHETMAADFTDYVACLVSEESLHIEVFSIRYGVLCIALQQFVDISGFLGRWQELAANILINFYSNTPRAINFDGSAYFDSNSSLEGNHSDEEEIKKATVAKNVASKRKIALCGNAANLKNHLKVLSEYSLICNSKAIPAQIAERIGHLEMTTPSIQHALSPTDYRLAVEQLAKLVHLPDITTCEVYDCSHWAGDCATGACVFFDLSGSSFRKTKSITIVRAKQKIQDDLELITMSLLRRVQINIPLPNLFVIDGGKNQLNAAIKALSENDKTSNIPIVAVTKGSDRLGTKTPHILYFLDSHGQQGNFVAEPNTPLCTLMFGIVFEAHKKAIGSHRQWTKKSTLQS